MSTPTCIKQPNEKRLYAMDFSALLTEGDSIASVVSVTATPSGLTLSGSGAVDGASVTQRIEGGTSGVRYTVTFVVLTTDNNTLESEGVLQVRNN